MNDKRPFNPLYDEPIKKDWVVSKFPIKGGTVIRAAMQEDLFFKAVQWSQIEGKIKS